MKVIILGSSGMVGSGVLMECIDNPKVSEILLINRKAGTRQHAKIKELIHPDFCNFESLGDQLKNYDACFFCLGVSAVGLKEEAYHKITFELTLAFAKVLSRANKQLTFCYVSGEGTDSTERGKSMWARVKGKTENALLDLPFKDAYMFRPGYIQPMKGIKSKTALYSAIYTLFTPLYYLLKPFKSLVTDSVSLGKAMLAVCEKGYTKKILRNADINKLAKQEGQAEAR